MPAYTGAFPGCSTSCLHLCTGTQIKLFPRTGSHCTALLHDIGRAEQYTTGTPHDEAGARIAETILSDLDFSSEEKESILSAIEEHRSSGKETSILSQLIYEADKKSRNCFLCEAEPQCYWSPQKKNMTIQY